MKNIFKSITITFSILFLLILNITNANAQCSIVGINSGGTTITISISCDFPVFINTGNAQADDEVYTSEKNTWIANHLEDYNAINSLSDSYFEIHQDDLNAMTSAKKTAILENPDRYHIIP